MANAWSSIPAALAGVDAGAVADVAGGLAGGALLALPVLLAAALLFRRARAGVRARR
jgi:hypothetical protein